MADLIASIGIILAIYLLVMGLLIMWNKEDKWCKQNLKIEKDELQVKKNATR